MTDFPEPMPSMSTPLLQLSSSSTDIRTELNHRPRRHTIITRPDSGMALLSDMEATTDDDEQDQQQFDRISGILSSLIQEANDAVHGNRKAEHAVQIPSTRPSKTPTSRSSKTPARIFTSSTIISKIPRRASNTPSSIQHHRNASSSSTSSTNTTSLFSPISSTSTSATLSSRSPSPTLTNFKKQLFRHHHHHHVQLRPRSCPVIQAAPLNRRSSITPNQKKIDPITESFKRLDTSMALVDSLSRDLATPKSNNNLTLLLLVPLLHIPHSLMTMIFDFVTSNPAATTSNSQLKTSSFSFSSMIFWACVFAVTNLMVDQVAIPNKIISSSTKKMKVRRMSLPGTYISVKNKSSKVPNKSHTATVVVAPVKRTWIPATIQQQYQFRLGGEELPQPQQKRRNSV